jgi:hypothetical protein
MLDRADHARSWRLPGVGRQFRERSRMRFASSSTVRKRGGTFEHDGVGVFEGQAITFGGLDFGSKDGWHSIYADLHSCVRRH